MGRDQHASKADEERTFEENEKLTTPPSRRGRDDQDSRLAIPTASVFPVSVRDALFHGQTGVRCNRNRRAFVVTGQPRHYRNVCTWPRSSHSLKDQMPEEDIPDPRSEPPCPGTWLSAIRPPGKRCRSQETVWRKRMTVVRLTLQSPMPPRGGQTLAARARWRSLGPRGRSPTSGGPSGKMPCISRSGDGCFAAENHMYYCAVSHHAVAPTGACKCLMAKVAFEIDGRSAMPPSVLLVGMCG